jgi:hypothetical protein
VRINIGAYLLWMAVLAVALLHTRDQPKVTVLDTVHRVKRQRPERRKDEGSGNGRIKITAQPRRLLRRLAMSSRNVNSTSRWRLSVT